MNNWNPEGAGVSNGNYFGFPYSTDESNLVLLSVPWDVTTSYGSGAASGPKAIVDASTQLDFFHFSHPKAWEKKLGTLPVDPWISRTSAINRKKAEAVIDELEKGHEPDQTLINEINQASQILNDRIETSCEQWLNKGKKIGLIGGDHSTPLGLYKALDQVHEDWGILQIDAHADLRKAYEGFTYSHASIMYNTLQETDVHSIVQVGLRDLCQSEFTLADTHERVHLIPNREIHFDLLSGGNWRQWCKKIVALLPPKVHISFDIDGLEPHLCPNTGTPVPGGLSFEMVQMLLETLHEQQKQIIGFDLVEVCPGSDTDWDANVGARILYELCQYSL